MATAPNKGTASSASEAAPSKQNSGSVNPISEATKLYDAIKTALQGYSPAWKIPPTNKKEDCNKQEPEG